MRQADLTGTDRTPAAYESCRGNTVMWVSVRSRAPQQGLGALANDRMDTERLLKLNLLYGRKDARHTLGEHGLAGSRGPDHHQAQASRCRNRQSPLRDFLTHDIAVIKR